MLAARTPPYHHLMVRSATSSILTLAAATLAVAGCQGQAVWDERDGAVVLTEQSRVAMPESDDVPAHTAVVVDHDGHEHRLPLSRAAIVWPKAGVTGRVAFVRDDNVLVSKTARGARVLLDGVIGAPAIYDADHVIAARQTEPGETDLWLVSDDGAPPVAIAPGPGADDTPIALADGRVVFVSGRSGVASLWLWTKGQEPRQLTNVGEVPGALSSSFVPVPEQGTWVSEAASALTYEVDGRAVRVALPALGVLR